MTPSIQHVAVLIPARNEESLLPRCLNSALRALGTLPSEITSDIIVVVDRSTDQTLKVARSMLQGYGAAFTTLKGIVGVARAHAAKVALARYGGPPECCWLANTDADCVVPENWLVDQMLFASMGAHAVAGTVEVDSFSEHCNGAAHLFHDTYTIHSDGTHPHVHGANIGIRADLYLEAGGWASLATAEDHDLWDRLSLLDCRKLSPAGLAVITSGRRIGRAPHGFAQALAAHNKAVA
jgi:glycosyltransferase involved in cell wall biosynthesis